MNVEKIEIEFLSHKTNNFFNVDVLNHKDFLKSDNLIDSKNKKIKLEIFSIKKDSFIIELMFYGKTNRDTQIDKNGNILDDTFLETKKILFDNININLDIILPLTSFVPFYSEQELQYLKKNNINLQERAQHNFNFYYNGKLSFNLKNFYWEYNRFLNSGYDYYNKKTKYSHLGMYEESDIQELNRLLNELSK